MEPSNFRRGCVGPSRFRRQCMGPSSSGSGPSSFARSPVDREVYNSSHEQMNKILKSRAQ